MFLGEVTCGGFVTDEHARVLAKNDAPIARLYATGNITATIVGRAYLGSGGSIGGTMLSGYIAAEHACGVASRIAPGRVTSAVPISRGPR